MKSGLRIILWIGVACLIAAAIATFISGSHSDPAGRGMAQGLGCLLAVVAIGGAGALLLARFWRGWLVIGAIVLALPLVLMGVIMIGQAINQARNQREMENAQSGRTDFSDQPALLAVASAISRNDENAIRAAAKNVPDLNAAGRDGKTLLFFAVDEALERPELVKAVETLLSLGANPNYNNGQLNSFAMWRAVNGEVRLLRAMLDAGGNPNAPDFRGNPIIFDIWDQNYFEADRPMRFRLLLDRGADVNSTLPPNAPSFPGYTIAMFRARVGTFEPLAYIDVLELLKRGADFNRVGDEEMTLVKILEKHRAQFSSEGREAPPEYVALVDWLKTNGTNL